MQSGMLIYYLKHQESSVYFETLLFDINGYVDEQCFKNAWQMIIKNNEALRTEIVWQNLDSPVQIILKHHEGNIELYDYTKFEDCIKFEKIDLKVNLEQIPFKIILYKYEKDKYKFVMSSHHILFDGWSTAILLQEFASVYHQLIHKEQVIFGHKSKYKDYLKELKKLDKESEKKFWTNYFKNFDFRTVGYFNRMTGNQMSCVIDNEQISLENPLAMQQFITKNQITLASYIYTAWAIVLSKHTRLEDISFGTTVSGRTLSVRYIENMVGLFINTIPFRKKIDKNDDILKVLCETNELISERKPFEVTSQFDIKKYCECKDELFDSIVVIENYPLNVDGMMKDSMFEIVQEPLLIEGEYDVIINVAVNGEIVITISYNKNKISFESISEVSNYLKCTLEEMADQHKLKICDLGIYNQVMSYTDTEKLDLEDFDFNV